MSAGTLHRVDHGWYVDMPTWRTAYSEGRHLMRVVASHERRRGMDAVYSLTSAAVLHELPLVRLEPKHIHVSGGNVNGRAWKNAATVSRHEIPIPSEDIVFIDGIRCTSLARTVADTIRYARVETALAIADAAIRRIAWDETTRTYHPEAAEALRADIAARLPRGGRGVRQGRWICERADGRAQLPGETISRLYLLQLGFAPPRLRVAVPSPSGGSYFIDFGLDDVGAWGEFDGVGKYLDPAIRGDSDMERTLLDEKMREDWIRGTTQRPFARWGSAHIQSAVTLGERLAAFHIFPPR